MVQVMKLDVDGLKANAAKIVLSKAQREWLIGLRDNGPKRANGNYKPATTTADLGLSLRSEHSMGFATHTITDAGCQWLKERGL